MKLWGGTFQAENIGESKFSMLKAQKEGQCDWSLETEVKNINSEIEKKWGPEEVGFFFARLRIWNSILNSIITH